MTTHEGTTGYCTIEQVRISLTYPVTTHSGHHLLHARTGENQSNLSRNNASRLRLLHIRTGENQSNQSPHQGTTGYCTLEQVRISLTYPVTTHQSTTYCTLEQVRISLIYPMQTHLEHLLLHARTDDNQSNLSRYNASRAPHIVRYS
jgi:hypothetical protein